MAEVPDPNPMPEFDPFPGISRAREILVGAYHFLADRHRSAGLSSHFQSHTENTGGGPLIDRELYDSRIIPDIAGRDLEKHRTGNKRL